MGLAGQGTGSGLADWGSWAGGGVGEELVEAPAGQK